MDKTKQIILILCIVSFFFILNSPVDFPAGIIVNIKEGESLRNVSFQLKENNIIRSRLAFEAFVILYGGEKHLVSADYLFEGKLPVFEIAKRISKGERNLAPVKVTIPEGFNTFDIATAFAPRLPNFNKDEFLLETKNLEGYLFPDTYFFFTTDGESEVVKSMSKNYEKKIAPLLSQIISSGKTEKEIIIMASLVEKEAKDGNDRAFISGILWKRFNMNMPLQVDSAPETYKAIGLPKSPISNPGLAAIEATINPQKSNYLYYLHDKNGNIHYALTFIEHQQNIFKYVK